MDPHTPTRAEVDRFVIEQIESVPHLEALLLLWNARPHAKTLQELAKALYLSEDQTQPIVRDLLQRDLIVAHADVYSYNAAHSKSEIIAMLDSVYRREVVRISTMIHSKPSASVRAFARAFKLTKD